MQKLFFTMISGKALHLVHLLGLMLFMFAFFPMKKKLPGFAEKEDMPIEPFDHINKTGNHSTLPYGFSLKNVVIIVIDGFRTDFVANNDSAVNFPYLSKLLQEKDGILFSGKARPPTVTMPRLKAITTGDIPGFVDAVLNLNSLSLDEDNIITQAWMIGKKLVFYGDDTWLNLFPYQFIRSEGVKSFYVADYSEVDNNVTRHVNSELQRKDWDFLVLHYLGLDHIGHLEGPFSTLVPKKLQEMDTIIRQIHVELQRREKEKGESSMIFICGDHGMSDYGSHGGATIHEVSVPLIFVHSRAKAFSRVQHDPRHIKPQTSVAPTLAVLMGLPIPKNVLSPVLHQVLVDLDDRRKLYAMYANFHQFVRLKKFYGDTTDDTLGRTAVSLHNDWLKDFIVNGTTYRNAADILNRYSVAMEEMENEISHLLTNHDLLLMAAAIVVLWEVIFFCQFQNEKSNCHSKGCGNILLYSASGENVTTIESLKTSWWFPLFIFFVILNTVVCVSTRSTSCLCCWKSPWIVFAICTLGFVSWLTGECIKVFNSITTLRWPHLTLLSSFQLLAGLLHSLSFASSSFVEEEHQTWYFFSATFHLLLLYSVLQRFFAISSKDTTIITRKDCLANIMYVIGSAVCSRILRHWNQTGDKWAHLDDLKKYLMKSENVNILTALFLSGLVALFLMRCWYHNTITRIVLLLGIYFVYNYRAAAKNIASIPILNTVVGEFVAVYLVYAIVVIILFSPLLTDTKTFSRRKKSVLSSVITAWVLLCSLLLRPHNVPLFAIINLQELLLSRVIKNGILHEIEAGYMYYMMAMASYFYQGNSNSLARIDLASGYIGLTEHQLVVFGLLVTCHTGAGLGFWLLSLFYRIYHQNHPSNFSSTMGNSITVVLCLSRALPVAVFVIIVTLLRHHLFVWSVFSPKLLFEFTNSFFTGVILWSIPLTV